MRLHSRRGASQIHSEVTKFDPNTGAATIEPLVIEPDENGVFEVPPVLGAHLLATHIEGEKVWENDAELNDRLTIEEAARRKDPATLLAAVEAGAQGNPQLLDRIDALIAAIRGEGRSLTPTVADQVAEAEADAKEPELAEAKRKADETAALQAQAAADAESRLTSTLPVVTEPTPEIKPADAVEVDDKADDDAPAF